MTILYTITSYPPAIGGAQLHLHEFARRVAQTRRVGVAYHWDTHRTDWLLGTTLHAPVAGDAPVMRDGVPTLRIALTDAERRQLAVWVRGYWLMQGAALDRLSAAFTAHLERAAHQLSEEPLRIVHNSRIGREALTMASLHYAHARRLPFVFTPNHHDHWHGWRYRHYLNVYRRADLVITHTEYEREMLIALGVHPDRISVLGVGAILADHAYPEQMRARLKLAPDVPIILFLGQKLAYKRWDALLEAMPMVWQRHPRAVCLCIGPRTPHSTAVFARLNDPRIIEWDEVDLQTKTNALAAAHVLCVPSQRESFGGVYLEAWAFGKPVIAGSAPAVREIVVPGENGWRIDADKRASIPAQIADALSTALSDPAQAQALGAAGHMIFQRYGWDALTTRLGALYDRLL